MHELSLCRSIVSIVAARAAGRKVVRVGLAVGALSCVSVEALRFCFGVCAEGTRVEGATLTVETVPGRARCLGCEEELAIAEPIGRCPCEKRARLEIIAGEELLVREMEVETCVEPADAAETPP